MARITLPVIAIAVALSAIPGGLAGPACINKQWDSVEVCIQKCNNKWGWTGHIMGSDRWGVVVKPATGSEDPKKAVESACKAKFSASPKTVSTTKSAAYSSITPIVNAQSAPADVSTSSVEAVTSSSATPSRLTTIRKSSASTSSTPSSTSTSTSTSSATRGLATFANTTFSKAEGNTAIAEETTKSLPPKITTSEEPETTSTPPPQTTTKAPPKTTTAAPPPPKTTQDSGNGNKGNNDGGNNDNGGNNNGNDNGGNTDNGGNNNGNNSGNSGNNGGSNSGSSSGTVSPADQQRYLKAHNTIRAQHGANPLSWADDLEAAAQKWANNCVFKHSGGTLGPFGENLAAGTGNGYTIESAVKSWTDEVSEFNSGNPQPSHFTQVVWKASTEVGCAVADCDGIFDASFGKAHFHVCEYRKQGNVIGQFGENVQV